MTPSDGSIGRRKPRTIADQMTDPLRKRIMLDIAVCYVALAHMAEEWDAGRLKCKD
jgi:hypothetical protein